MKERLDHWLDSFEKFHQQYIIIPTESSNYSFPENIIFISVMTPQGFLNTIMKQDFISMQPSKCYIKMFFLDHFY